ncbi:MAG: hypothetical protein ACSLE8_06290 [Rhodococcus sp. (in: high G+C Gram-positive bacteria)]
MRKRGMTALYYVVTYSSRLNQYARFMVTADNEDDAKFRVVEDNWVAHKVIYICHTAKPIEMEV